MKTKLIVLMLMLLLLLMAGGCSTLRKSKSGYSGPPEYAQYFTKGSPTQVVDQAIVELSAEVGVPLTWDWGRIVVVRKPTVRWQAGWPVIDVDSQGVVAYAQTPLRKISISDADFVYPRFVFLHEFGHILLEENGVMNHVVDHHSLPFFKRTMPRPR